MNLYFPVRWSRKDKALTWSGTTYALFKELEKYFNVIEMDVPRIRFSHTLMRLHIRENDFLVSEILKKRKELTPQVKEGVVFQFCEYINKPGVKTYLYQDLNPSYILWMHQTNSPALKYSGFDNLKPQFAELRASLQKEYYESCSGIFTMGRWLADFLVKECGYSKEKVHAVGGGINIDCTRFHPVEKNNNRILFVGRDFIRKGGMCVINAFKILRTKNPQLELYIAGPKKNPVKELINGLYFLGDLPHEKLDNYFNLCDIFCMPSYFEAYGLVFIEALCAGLPCIGRKAYEMPYFIEDNETGYLINDDDPVKLAGKMEDLLQNERIKNNVKKKRNDYLDEYSWEKVGKRIKNIILETS